MKKYLNLILFIVVVFIVVFFWLDIKSKGQKFGYVEIESVYNEFPLKKELEAKLTNVQQARKNILDSLKIQLNAISMSIKSEKDVQGLQLFQIKKQEFLSKQQNFEEDNQAAMQSYSEQVWKQINQYVKDYGVENKYNYIFGTDGTGALMFASDQEDITKELSVYVNERYKGEKK